MAARGSHSTGASDSVRYVVIVDQPASIGALPLTVARARGCRVVCPPGLAMRRDRQSLRQRGEGRRDRRDAAHTLRHPLRSLEVTNEITAELTVLVGFDKNLAPAATRTSNPHPWPAHPHSLGPHAVLLVVTALCATT
ncbi:IS110 family transposase [Streptomyces nigra]|uniref:IS110 family transposase n=1 Tax=Streptomyces nigra TaxID=1827580 RepID=UPI003649DDE3